MPQTTPERAARWPGMDAEAIDYLRARGYTLLRNWSWLMPEDKTMPDEREEDAILYLIEEWDFDGWVRPDSGDPRQEQPGAEPGTCAESTMPAEER